MRWIRRSVRHISCALTDCRVPTPQPDVVRELDNITARMDRIIDQRRENNRMEMAYLQRLRRHTVRRGEHYRNG